MQLCQLSFADDLILFGNEDVKALRCLKDAFTSFSAMFRLFVTRVSPKFLWVVYMVRGRMVLSGHLALLRGPYPLNTLEYLSPHRN